MFQYIFRRVILAIPVLLGILIVTFLLARMIPGDPCRAMLGEKTHVLEVAGRPAAHIRECIFQIMRQTLNHLCSPSLCFLTQQNIAPNAAIKLHQLGING